MGWQEAHRYYAALRDVERELDHAGDGTLPWHTGYGEIFGDRRGLLLALRRRWDLMVQAQIDPDGGSRKRLRELAGEHPGLVRALGVEVADSARRAAFPRCRVGGAA